MTPYRRCTADQQSCRVIVARSLVTLLAFWPCVALGQMTGRFYLEKNTLAVGEPVFLCFKATNSGAETQNVGRADPYSFCSGYQIHLSSDIASGSSCAPMAVGGSCLSSDEPIAPGKAIVERILLNYEHNLDSAGNYELEANRDVGYAPAREDFFRAAKNRLQVHARLTFRVDENALWDGSRLQGWVEQLQSTDLQKQREAARTLASLAPKSLEDVLLGFANNSNLREWAPLAFHRLNTSRSLGALAKMLDTTKPGTYEHLEAADFLGQTGDPKWFPKLLKIAQENSKIANYVDDAAKSGGNKMVPVLLSMLGSEDTEFARPNVVSAFGYTGSRSAVPILLNLLRSAETGTAERALYGLRQLTHRDIGGNRWFDNPQAQYPAWVRWWNAEGSSAPIYKATECGEVKPLR
jgi:hypothetical protein